MKRIAIDMDDVMSDTTGRKIEWYERDFKVKVNREEMKGKYLNQHVPIKHKGAVREYARHPEFFKELDIFPECQRVIEDLTKKFDVFIVTATMPYPNSYVYKYEWMKKNFPFIDIRNVVYCGHKYMIDADYMIDDHAYNLETFKGKGLLYSCEHNSEDTRFERLDNWFDVENFFLNL